MRLPRLRFTIGGVMMAFTVTGSAFGLLARQRRFEALAAYHASKMHYGIRCSRSGPTTYYDINGTAMPWDEAQAAVWHAALAEKYRKAAARPWLTVEPDPPKPGR
jgi:hypothetical protein